MRKALYFLGILDDSDIDWMIVAGTRQRIPAGSFLIEEGKPTGCVSIVIGGAFSIRAAALGGREIARLEAGEIVGEMSFVDARPPSASVVAIEDSWVLAVPTIALDARLGDPAFAARFYRSLAVFLANRLRATVGRLGYGQPAQDVGEEIGDTALETLSVAGARLDWLLARLRGGD